MPDAIISINNLQFSWPNQSEVILDIDQLSVKHNEKLFIEGPSGSGKTSLLNLIGAVTSPTAGSIHVLKQDLAGLQGSTRDQFRADHIGFIFQQFNLVPYLSMLENVTLPCRFSSIREKRAIEHHQLEQEALRLLDQLGLNSTQLKRKAVTELSVGQQQRVAAARAMIGSPEIIIADEPTSALDSNTREDFIKLLFEECEKSGSSIIFVSHDHALAKLFDRSVYLPDLNRNHNAGETN